MEYEPLEVIGHGSYGQIRRVRRKSDGQILVRKEISYKYMNQKERTQLISEFRILKRLDHPNIVRYLHHEHCQDEQQVHLYMEYCGGGDLARVIRGLKESGQTAPEHMIWTVFTQLVLALYRCHYNALPPENTNIFSDDGPRSVGPPHTFVLHRDIKPENIFLDGDGVIKLGDFGLAKLLDSDNPLAVTYVGTPYYMSPEVLLDQPSTPASDVWSLGCVIYELCTLHKPFQAKSHLALSQKIQEGTFEPIGSGYSQTLARTISACLNLSPAARPTAATLLRLDVTKICRKELELERERRLLADERRRLEIARADVEREIYARLERELSAAIDDEVERRVEQALRKASAAALLPDSQRSSSPDRVDRRLRGPRSIHDTFIAPLQAERQRPDRPLVDSLLSTAVREPKAAVAKSV